MTLDPIAPIAITGPPGIVALLFLWWYYSRLNRPDVPPSRRKLRQASVVVMVVAVPMLLTGVSLVDHSRTPEQFVVVWLGLVILLFLLMWLAILDALNTLRLSRHERRGLRGTAQEMLDRTGESAPDTSELAERAESDDPEQS